MGEVSYEPLIRDMTWSYSRIRTFEDCAYKFFIKYIKYPDCVRKALFFSTYGTFMHEILAMFYKGELTRREAQEKYLGEFRTKVQGSAPSTKVYGGYFLDGLRYLNEVEPIEDTILSIESKVDFSIQNIPFVGYVDLLTSNKKGRVFITDNKSRALKPRSGKNKPTKSDSELDEYLRQLYLYAVAIKNIYGVYPEALRFNCFRKGIIIEEPFNEEALSKSINWFSRKVEEIISEEDFAPNIEYFKCRYLCEVQRHCCYYSISYGDKVGDI